MGFDVVDQDVMGLYLKLVKKKISISSPSKSPRRLGKVLDAIET